MNPLRAAIRILFVLSLLISDLHADPRPERTIPDGSDTRDRFLKLIARPQVPLAPNERTPSSTDGLTEIGFDFAAEANQRVPGLMIRSINLILPCPNSMGFPLNGTSLTKRGSTNRSVSHFQIKTAEIDHADSPAGTCGGSINFRSSSPQKVLRV